MGDHQRGEPPLSQPAPQRRAQVPAGARIQRRERLVEEQRPRLRRQRAGQRHALPLSSGERRGRPARKRHQIEPGQPVRRALLPLGPRQGGEAEGHVLLHVEVGEERVVLWNVADPPVLGRGIDARFGVEEGGARQRDAPRVGPQHAEQQAQERALAGAIGPGDEQGLVGSGERHVQVERAHPLLHAELKHGGDPQPRGGARGAARRPPRPSPARALAPRAGRTPSRCTRQAATSACAR
jgi:hypothetical protein